MKHDISDDDRAFASAMEACEIDLRQFDHRAHLRLAYTLLVQTGGTGVVERMRNCLRAFLAHHGVDPVKYHETLTRAWLDAVRHFMEQSEACVDADAFVDRHPMLLDADLMLSHYSAQHLFSDTARMRFVHPDLQAIPPAADREAPDHDREEDSRP